MVYPSDGTLFGNKKGKDTDTAATLMNLENLTQKEKVSHKMSHVGDSIYKKCPLQANS